MKKAALALLIVLLAALAVAAVVLVVRPPFAAPALELVGIHGSQTPSAGGDASFQDVGDAAMNSAERAAEEALILERSRTPLIAQAGDLLLRSPVAPADLTGVLFHQASFNYALVLTTQLPEADYERVQQKRQIRVNTAQEEGEWLDADALHLWRTSDATDLDTSIDVGALPGTTVYAPVTGTVVLVKDYMLYDEVPDIEIHIQPQGRKDLDCVLIHTSDPLVAAGDAVEAGITPISHVRDIEKDLTDVQLGFYTPEGVGGNHTHVQVNDATAEGYRKNKLKGAVKVPAA